MNTITYRTFVALKVLLFCFVLTNAPNSIADTQNPQPPKSTEAQYRVSINSADAATLAANLDGIGEAKAQRIIAWRETNGHFETAEQLLEVKGIGKATLQKNLDRIAL